MFYLRVCERLFNKRVLFITKKERISTSSPSTKAGDLTYSILGMLTPVLMRKTCETEELEQFSRVGPCIMNTMWYDHEDGRRYDRVTILYYSEECLGTFSPEVAPTGTVTPRAYRL